MPSKKNEKLFDPFADLKAVREFETDEGDAAWEILIRHEPEIAGPILGCFLVRAGFGDYRGATDSVSLYNFVYYYFSKALRVSPRFAIDCLSDLFLPTLRPNEDKAKEAIKKLFARRPLEGRRFFVMLFRAAGLRDYRHDGDSMTVFNFGLSLFNLVREVASEDAAKIIETLFVGVNPPIGRS